MTTTTTAQDIMDLISKAGRLVLAGHVDGVSKVWDTMSSRQRLAFDLFLVRVKHVMATRAGSPEWRFNEVVLRHVELARQAGLTITLTPEEELWADEAAAWSAANQKDLDRAGETR